MIGSRVWYRKLDALEKALREEGVEDFTATQAQGRGGSKALVKIEAQKWEASFVWRVHEDKSQAAETHANSQGIFVYEDGRSHLFETEPTKREPIKRIAKAIATLLRSLGLVPEKAPS